MLFNLTLIAKNPNNHLIFFYDPFVVTVFSNSILVGNDSVTTFTSDKNNQTSLRVMLSGSQDLGTNSLTNLRSSLKMKKDFPIEIQMDTKVKMKMDWLKSKKAGIRVTCDGIRGTISTGKSPTVASVVDSECKVDLRVEIWKLPWWTPPSHRRTLCSPCHTPKHRFYYSDSPPSPSRLQDLPRGADVPNGENIHRRRSRCLI